MPLDATASVDLPLLDEIDPLIIRARMGGRKFARTPAIDGSPRWLSSDRAHYQTARLKMELEHFKSSAESRRYRELQYAYWDAAAQTHEELDKEMVK